MEWVVFLLLGWVAVGVIVSWVRWIAGASKGSGSDRPVAPVDPRHPFNQRHHRPGR
jgi:hypothetical protein